MKANPHNEKKLISILRNNCLGYFQYENVTSIGVGLKETGGEKTKELCIQFTVAQKFSLEALEDEKIPLLPESIVVEGETIKFDIVERSYRPNYEIVLEGDTYPQIRRTKQSTLRPGLSIANTKVTAGTLGLFVRDKENDEPLILSNWHVLHSPSGEIGDPISQPGKYDDSDFANNIIGTLRRSHLGKEGDCAVCSIHNRNLNPSVLELDVYPRRIANVNINDKVVKSGRTTGVTYGIVNRVGVFTKIDYGGNIGVREIGGFEISPNPQKPAANNQISMGGDSGSAWLIDDDSNKDIVVGLHFAGETPNSPTDYAIACNIVNVFSKLNLKLY